MGMQKIVIPVVAGLMAGAALAKATPEELEKIGKTYTCVGAEKAGTASGVPEYTGKWLGTPPGIDYNPHTGQHPPVVTRTEHGHPVNVRYLFYRMTLHLRQIIIRVGEDRPEGFSFCPWVRHGVYPVRPEIFSTPDIGHALVSRAETEVPVPHSCVMRCKTHQDGMEGHPVDGNAIYES